MTVVSRRSGRTVADLVDDEDGIATVEYAMLLALVVVGTLAAWQALGTAISDVLEESAAQISSGGN